MAHTHVCMYCLLYVLTIFRSCEVTVLYAVLTRNMISLDGHQVQDVHQLKFRKILLRVFQWAFKWCEVCTVSSANKNGKAYPCPGDHRQVQKATFHCVPVFRGCNHNPKRWQGNFLVPTHAYTSVGSDTREKAKGGLKWGRSRKSECEKTAIILSLILLEVVGNSMLLCLLKTLSQSLLESVRLFWVTSANFNTRLIEQIRLNPQWLICFSIYF